MLLLRSSNHSVSKINYTKSFPVLIQSSSHVGTCRVAEKHQLPRKWFSRKLVSSHCLPPGYSHVCVFFNKHFQLTPFIIRFLIHFPPGTMFRWKTAFTLSYAVIVVVVVVFSVYLPCRIECNFNDIQALPFLHYCTAKSFYKVHSLHHFFSSGGFPHNQSFKRNTNLHRLAWRKVALFRSDFRQLQTKRTQFGEVA